jgi:hypothetical protein
MGLPAEPHIVSGAAGVVTGVPLLQLPVEHAVDAGTFVLSTTVMMLPFPSHSRRLQVPGIDAATVPEAANLSPHTPAVHVRVAHAVSVPGHVLGPRH